MHMLKKEKASVNLDKEIVETILEQSKLRPGGVSFDVIYKNLSKIPGIDLPVAQVVFEDLERLIDYDELISRGEECGYITVDLDKYAKDLGVLDLIESSFK